MVFIFSLFGFSAVSSFYRSLTTKVDFAAAAVVVAVAVIVVVIVLNRMTQLDFKKVKVPAAACSSSGNKLILSKKYPPQGGIAKVRVS